MNLGGKDPLIYQRGIKIMNIKEIFSDLLFIFLFTSYVISIIVSFNCIEQIKLLFT